MEVRMYKEITDGWEKMSSLKEYHIHNRMVGGNAGIPQVEKKLKSEYWRAFGVKCNVNYYFVSPKTAKKGLISMIRNHSLPVVVVFGVGNGKFGLHCHCVVGVYIRTREG